MKISEYTLLEGAFDSSFGFMLNRIADLWPECPDFHKDAQKKELAAERCFSEFMVALEEMGVELEQAKVEP